MRLPERLDLLRVPERVYMHFTKLVIGISLERGLFFRAMKVLIEDADFRQLQNLHLDLESISVVYPPYRKIYLQQKKIADEKAQRGLNG